MRFHCLPLLAALLLVAPALPAATTILRGPYLQSATPTSLVVRWRTDTTEGSFVRYGLAADALTETTKAFGIGTEHIVQLSELLPGRRYLYRFVPAENKDRVITFDTTKRQLVENTSYVAESTEHQFTVDYVMSNHPSPSVP